ncbi:hypothetical protein BDF21DRAFT_347292 [Thamnidium elegans]|nr:hypothetical protein BDF21DRAFT_347292 [Thamnidium elegans]
MATEYPSAQFTGIDQVALFPHDIRPANVLFQKRDVLLGLDFEDNTFDFVQMRLFSLAFTRTQWAESLKEIYRVTKPGGYIQLLELQITDPGDEVVQTFVEKVCSLMENNDQDPEVCKKLSAIVSEAGYKPIEDIKKVINLQLMYIIDVSIESCKRLMFEIYDIESEEEFQELKRIYVESRMESSESAFHCCVGQKPLL